MTKINEKKEILCLKNLRKRRKDILEKFSTEYQIRNSELLEAKSNLRIHENFFHEFWDKYRKNSKYDPVAKQRFFVYCDELSNLIKKERVVQKELEKELDPFMKILSVVEKNITKLEKFEEKRSKLK